MRIPMPNPIPIPGTDGRFPWRTDTRFPGRTDDSRDGRTYLYSYFILVLWVLLLLLQCFREFRCPDVEIQFVMFKEFDKCLTARHVKYKLQSPREKKNLHTFSGGLVRPRPFNATGLDEKFSQFCTILKQQVGSKMPMFFHPPAPHKILKWFDGDRTISII